MTRIKQPDGMGWCPGRGTRPQAFRAGDVVPQSERAYRTWWANGWWGDQGLTSECTIYAWLHAIHDGPVTHRKAKRPIDNPTRLYKLGQTIDGASHYDVHSGLTTDAAAQVMLREGHIGEYRWAEELDEVLDCLLDVGPVLCGAWWPRGFDSPDTKGYVEHTSRNRGGHQFLLDAANKRQRIVRAKNSWGRAWGRDGFFYFSFDTLALLLRDGAECAIYRELPTRTTL